MPCGFGTELCAELSSNLGAELCAELANVIYFDESALLFP